MAPELVPVGAAQEVDAQVGVLHNLTMSNNRQIIDDKKYVHYVTFSILRRRQLLDHDHAKRIVLGVLNSTLEKRQAACIGFVIMPDHAHALLWFDKTGVISGFMHDWKRESSFHLRNWYRTSLPNYFAEFGEGDKFWQPKYYDFVIYDPEKLREKLNYMHENPVRAGLVFNTTDWLWSSARWYAWKRSVGVPSRWIE